MRISLILAAAAVCAACVSCGSKTKEQIDIKGMWSISDKDVEGGYIFGEDGLADVYMYPADSFFNENGLTFSGSYIPKKNISFDGNLLTVTMQGEELFTADRTDEPDTNSYNGEYTFISGKLADNIIESVGITDAGNTELRMLVEDDRIRVTVKDAIEYSFDGDRLELKGRNGIPDSSGDAELSGDTITVEREDGSSRVLTRIREDKQ